MARMPDIIGTLETEWDHATGTIRHRLHQPHPAPSPEETTMTDQPAITAPQQLTRWGRIHADVSGIGHALLHMAPVLERIATNPQVDQAVEVIMAMAGLGAEAHEFQSIIDLGTAVIARRQAALPRDEAGQVQATGVM